MDKLTDRWYEVGQSPDYEWEKVAYKFADHFVSQEYDEMFEMLTEECKSEYSKQLLAELHKEYSHDVKHSLGPVFLQNSWDVIHDKQDGDQGWSYICIGGLTNEAISTLVQKTQLGFKIREIMWGRP